MTNASVDAELLADLLTLLGRTEVILEKDVVADFAPFGLAPPAVEYVLSSEGGNSSALLAHIAFGTNEAGRVFTRRLDEFPDRVNSIPREIYQRLPQASWQLRDRRIWNFTTNEVVSLSIQHEGRSRKIIRNVKGNWVLDASSQGIINPLSLDEMFYRLGNLKAVFWVSQEKEPDEYGFKSSDHRITLEIKGSEKIETLSLEFGGMTEFGTRYAAVVLDGARVVFEFPWFFFFEVQDSLSLPKK